MQFPEDGCPIPSSGKAFSFISFHPDTPLDSQNPVVHFSNRIGAVVLMFRVVKSICWLAVGLIVPLSLGCGGDSGPKLDIAPAKGTVKLDGQPLPDVVVTFYPEEKGLPATGATNANGQFTLTTKEPGDGALVGKHKIAVNDKPEETNMEITSGDEYEPKPPKESRFPANYTKADQSGLSEEVKSSGNDFVIDLKSK